MAGTIGIKLANGDFYPLVEENIPAKKKLILTTAHDRQKSVQIKLFRSISKTMLDARHIGDMVVENIRPKPRGAPSIQMIISSDSSGNVFADAYDLDTNNGHQTLNVSLSDVSGLDYGDSMSQGDWTSTGSGRNDGMKKRRFPWGAMILATIIVFLAVSAIWFFFLDGRNTPLFAKSEPTFEATLPARPEAPVAPPAGIQPEIQPPPVVETPVVEPPVVVAEPPVAVVEPQEPVSPPVIVAPVAPPPVRPQAAVRVRPPAPVKSYRVPAVIPRNGVVYQIQWGDTLWDISEAFYRNPWLYPRIARYNNIKNPNLIISGFNIRIPPKE